MPLFLVGWLVMECVGLQPEAPGTRHLVVPSKPPFASVGKLKAEATCSASVVVDARIIVTAAHCVTRGERRVPGAAVAFEPSYPADGGPFHGRVVRLGPDLSSHSRTPADEANDWAIIILDAAPPGLRPLAIRALGPDEFPDLRDHVMLPGYSADVANGELLSVVEKCSIRAVRWDVLIHDCGCAKLASGAPLIVATGDGYAQVGINSAMLYLNDGDRPGRVLHAAVSVSSFAQALQEVVASLREDPSQDQHAALRQP